MSMKALYLMTVTSLLVTDTKTGDEESIERGYAQKISIEVQTFYSMVR